MTRALPACYAPTMTEISLWTGRLRLGDCYAVWTGSVGDAVAHRHFAAQAVFSSEPVAAIDARDQHVEGRCLLIEPNAPHRLLPAADAELWFVEPTAGFGPPPAMVERLTAAAPLLVSEEGGSAFWRDWLARSPRTPLDARVSQALAAIDRLIPTGSVRLADAAREAGLSLGRFRHLFAEEVGMPFQRHVLWRRMRVAFEALGRRATATEAAHAAGFSDSAHFARTIKAMFGVRATDLLFEA